MEDDVKTLSDYLSIAWRRKLHIILPFILILAITVVTVYVLPPVYKSTGTILIESQQIPKELIQSTVTSFADERIQIIKQRIMTGAQLFEIIQKFDLYADEIDTSPRSQILDDMRSRVAIDRVSANLRNRRRGSSALIAFTVSFEHRNPATAQRVANEIVTLFLAENIRTRTARAEETSEFLKRESDRLGDEITAMEEQIAAFKQEHEGSLPENLRTNLERVVTLKSELQRSETEIAALEEREKLLLIEKEALQLDTDVGLSAEQQARRRELEELQKSYISLSARYGAEHPDVKNIERQLAAFEREYGNLNDPEELEAQRQQVELEMAELMRKYSAEHPDVKKVARKLENLEKIINTQKAEKARPASTSANPQLMAVDAKLESIRNSVARIRKNRLDLERQIGELDARISKTPQVERGLDALERDYANTRRKYEEMKAKQLQAELSKSLEEEQKGERFTLLEPPVLPDKPFKPDRPKIFMLGLILSFVGGIGVAGVAESLDGGIRGARALASVTKMTPLVSIPYIATREDVSKKKRNIKIIVVVIALLAVAGLAAIHFFYKPLDILWYVLLRKLNLT